MIDYFIDILEAFLPVWENELVIVLAGFVVATIPVLIRKVVGLRV